MSQAPGVQVLDVQTDVDHNRSVVTFAGSKEGVQEAAFRGARAAAEFSRIEMRPLRPQKRM